MTMFKKLTNAIGEFVNIADLFGYIFVTLIILACWIGYNKTHQKAIDTTVKAKAKVEEIKSKVKELGEKASTTQIEITSPSSLESESGFSFSTYYQYFREKLSILNINTAKDTLRDINETVNDTISDTVGITPDPRKKSGTKGTPKIRSSQEDTRDSLSTL